MHQRTQISLVKRLFALIEGGATDMSAAYMRNPADAYTNAEVQRQEQQRLFRDRPLLICASCRISAAGDYVTDELSGIPILVVRDADGKLNAFANVCRHRGARVAKGCGSGVKSFVCPYHGWGYDLQGRLRAIAPRDAFPQLDQAQHGLVRLPVIERHGLVWVTPSPNLPLDESLLLGELDNEIASYNFESFAYYQSRTLKKQFNWKLAIDTFLESWHLDKLHRNSLSQIFLSGIGLVDVFGQHLRIVYPRRSILELRSQPDATWNLLRHSIIIYVLFPNSLVVWQGDHLEIWRMYPAMGKGPGHCFTEASLYAPKPIVEPSAATHWARNMDLLMQVVNGEDFVVAHDMQRGFEAGVQDCITFGRHEPALIYYHTILRNTLANSTKISRATEDSIG